MQIRETFLIPALMGAVAIGSASAATVSNPSFEADTFTAFPGYISGNSSVTGWTESTATQQGINPGPTSPFANNGTIPDGTKVGFIQTNGNTNSFSNTISGLTPGEQYELSYRVNTRNGQQTSMSVSVGGSTLVASNVTSVGGTNQYGYVVRTFTATGTTMPLQVSSSSPTDQTLLMDDFKVNAKTATPWKVSAWTGDSDSGINSSLTYTHAYNLGSLTSTTINGIAFTGIGGGNPSAANFTLDGPASAIGGDDANSLVTAGGGSGELAKRFVFNGNVNTLTLTGLVDGEAYRASIFGVGWDDANNPFRTSTFEADGERMTISEQQFGIDEGIRIDYEFIASGTTQIITYDALGGDSFHTYGIANALLIPEPSSTLLIGLALGGLGMRRKR